MSKTKNIITGFNNRIVIYDSKIDSSGVVHLFISSNDHQHICPDCDSDVCTINDSGRDRSVHHLTQSRRPSLIHFHQNHYMCSECGRTFMEQFDWLCSGTSMTRELYDRIADDLKHNSITSPRKIWPASTASLQMSMTASPNCSMSITSITDIFVHH